MTPIPTLTSFRSPLRLAVLGLLAGAAPVAAQTQPANGALPQTIPGLDNFTIAPRQQRLQPLPVPTPTPAPSATPTPAPAAPVRTPPIMIQPLPTPTPAPPPRARATPSPARRAPGPSPAPTSSPAPAPTPTPAPAIAAPVVAPTPAATSAATSAPARSLHPSLIWLFVFIAALILPGLIVAAWFYRRAQQGWAGVAAAPDDDDDDWVAPPPAPGPARPVPSAPVPRRVPGTTARPQLEVVLSPRRAGLNITSAAVDYELVVRNTGQAPARNVRLGVDLITAGNSHDTELRAMFEHGVERPIVAPFALAPGEHKGVKAMAVLPRDAVNVVSVKGRPMFVPMIGINLLYDWDGGAGQTATSHVIGIARGTDDRMKPFWLDGVPRMYDSVTEHAHAVAVRR